MKRMTSLWDVVSTKDHRNDVQLKPEKIMKKINSVLMMVAATLLFAFVASCNGTTDKEPDDQMNMSGDRMNEMGGGNMDEGQQATSPVVAAYMDIKNALVKDDSQAAQKAATVMMNEEEVNHEMKNHLDMIAGSSDLKQQRKYFSQLSNDLYGMAKNRKITDKATLYWNHCPMAMNGEGANWLSMSEKISNPYMGQKMPGCGSVKETLNH